MKTHLLVFAAIVVASTNAFSAGPAQNAAPPRMADIIAHMESIYRGEVTAIQLDTADNKPAHYHVQLRYPENRFVSFDVDAATRTVSTHDATAAAPAFATLTEIATLIAAQLPGQLTMMEFDGGAGVAPHYDVDVRVPGGVARLKVDAKNRRIDWRQPAVIRQ